MTTNTKRFNSPQDLLWEHRDDAEAICKQHGYQFIVGRLDSKSTNKVKDAPAGNKVIVHVEGEYVTEIIDVQKGK